MKSNYKASVGLRAACRAISHLPPTKTVSVSLVLLRGSVGAGCVPAKAKTTLSPCHVNLERRSVAAAYLCRMSTPPRLLDRLRSLASRTRSSMISRARACATRKRWSESDRVWSGRQVFCDGWPPPPVQ